MTKKPEALRLADAIYEKASKEADRRNSAYDYFGMDNTPESVDPNGTEAAACLRRQHAEIQELREALERIAAQKMSMHSTYVRMIDEIQGISDSALAKYGEQK